MHDYGVALEELALVNEDTRSDLPQHTVAPSVGGVQPSHAHTFD
jgi:hypothetical protein